MTIEVGAREGRILEKLAQNNDTDVAEIIFLMLEHVDRVIKYYDLKDTYEEV